MKKILTAALLLAFSSALCFAGDAAVFTDIGFSDDGQIYIFGQYGKTDGDFEAWAEIYTVDVVENDYVPNEVYRATFPVSSDVTVSGKQAFETLLQRTEWKLAKYDYEPTSVWNLIYVAENEAKNPLDEIVFKDYEASTTTKTINYHIRLVPTYEGTGKNTKSSFYINLEKQDQNGNVILSKKVGTIGFKRDGITGYRIARIFTDDKNKSLIFVVEKTLEDDTGTSIRYMVEAVRL